MFVEASTIFMSAVMVHLVQVQPVLDVCVCVQYTNKKAGVVNKRTHHASALTLDLK